jgi:hypothetical protein
LENTLNSDEAEGRVRINLPTEGLELTVRTGFLGNASILEVSGAGIQMIGARELMLAIQGVVQFYLPLLNLVVYCLKYFLFYPIWGLLIPWSFHFVCVSDTGLELKVYTSGHSSSPFLFF